MYWTDAGDSETRRARMEKRERDEVSSVRSHHTLADIALISGPREEQRAHRHTRTHCYVVAGM